LERTKAGGTISQQAVVHPWLAADAHGNKKTNKYAAEKSYLVSLDDVALFSALFTNTFIQSG
jgi:hypothetical protein